MPKLHIVGLGPGDSGELTLSTYRLLKRAGKVFVRTLQHPCVADLGREGVVFESFDNLYDEKDSFEEVYAGIVTRLQAELEQNAEVFFAVPGHPWVAEKTVALLVDKLGAAADVIVYPALSFLDNLFSSIPFDPVNGLLVRNVGDLAPLSLTGKDWLVVPQVFNKLIASEVKLDLMNFYPDEAPIFLVQRLGTAGQKVERLRLHELDHGEFDHLTTVVVPPDEEVPSLAKLAAVMAALRAPGGCPWDREQNHATLKRYLLEESYEVLDAIDSGDMYNLCEELGDLLLQVVFHAQIAAENGEFDLKDVLAGIISKLIRRHPHVFGDVRAETAGEVVRNWEQIKQEEKVDDRGETKAANYFAGAKTLPALMLADWTQRKVATAGFDWADYRGPLAKIEEETAELKAAITGGEGIAEELGDLLFAVVNVARFLRLDAEACLRKTVLKFQGRFTLMTELIAAAGHDLRDLSLEEMDVYWEKAKTQEKCGKIGAV